jgi:hypothetical protein
MRRIAALMAATAILMAMTLSASAAIHPIVCSGNAVANGLVDNPARSDDIRNPPGLTPDDVVFAGLPHEDALMAGDNNPTINPLTGLSMNQFAPLAAQDFDGTRPNWFKDCGPTP